MDESSADINFFWWSFSFFYRTKGPLSNYDLYVESFYFQPELSATETTCGVRGFSGGLRKGGAANSVAPTCLFDPVQTVCDVTLRCPALFR